MANKKLINKKGLTLPLLAKILKVNSRTIDQDIKDYKEKIGLSKTAVSYRL